MRGMSSCLPSPRLHLQALKVQPLRSRGVPWLGLVRPSLAHMSTTVQGKLAGYVMQSALRLDIVMLPQGTTGTPVLSLPLLLHRPQLQQGLPLFLRSTLLCGPL